MKNIFRGALLCVTVAFFAACSNGDYVANPANASNSSINPLDPLKPADFTWTGTEPISADVNGVNMVFSGGWALDSGKNIIAGTNGTSWMYLSLKDVYAVNLYGMGYNTYTTWGAYWDSLGVSGSAYYSYLGNSGAVYITRNDSAGMVGQFYFLGVNARGQYKNITHGYFKIDKL